MRREEPLPHPPQVLRQLGIVPNRRLGQNFLLSLDLFENMLDEAAVCASDCVLEVGTGLGGTTRLISERAGRVIGVEVDERLARITSETVADRPNVRLLQQDVLESKKVVAPEVMAGLQEAVRGGYHLKHVANLPYSVASPLIINLLESPLGFLGAWVMVQREVADRLTAEPGSKAWGPLGVMAQLWADVRRLQSVSPRSFWPAPKVESMTVELRRTEERRRQVSDYDVFAGLVRRVFQGRRKLLKNPLSAFVPEADATELMARADVPSRMRSDQVSLPALIRLANAVAAFQRNG